MFSEIALFKTRYRLGGDNMKAIIEFEEEPHARRRERMFITDILSIEQIAGEIPYIRFVTKQYQAAFPWSVIKRLGVVNDEE